MDYSLSLLHLSSPKRPRPPHTCRSGAESESGSAFSTPYASAPSSPRRACFFREEVEEAPLGEVRAAIPFIWEQVPGTPLRDHHQAMLSFTQLVREEDEDEDQEDEEQQQDQEEDEEEDDEESGARPQAPARQENSFEYLAEQTRESTQLSATNTSSDDVSGETSSSSELSDEEFDFGAKTVASPTKEEVLNSMSSNSNNNNNNNEDKKEKMSRAEELFLKGHMLPLSLPLRLQHLKRVVLQTSDSSRSDSSTATMSSSSSSRSQWSPLPRGVAAAIRSATASCSASSRFRTLYGFARNGRETTADVEENMMMKESAGRLHAERKSRHRRRKSRSLSPSRSDSSSLFIINNNNNDRGGGSDSATSSIDSEAAAVAQASLDLSFTDLASYPASSDLDHPSSFDSGSLKDFWPQEHHESNKILNLDHDVFHSGRSRPTWMMMMMSEEEEEADVVLSPDKNLSAAMISLLASSEEMSLPSLSPIPEVDKSASVHMMNKNQDKNQEDKNEGDRNQAQNSEDQNQQDKNQAQNQQDKNQAQNQEDKNEGDRNQAQNPEDQNQQDKNQAQNQEDKNQQDKNQQDRNHQDKNQQEVQNQEQKSCARSSSLKETSNRRSDSRLVSLARFTFHSRKLKSSSSRLTSAVAPHDMHMKPFMFYRLRRAFFGGCIGFTPTTDEQEFAGLIHESVEERTSSQKLL